MRLPTLALAALLAQTCPPDAAAQTARQTRNGAPELRRVADRYAGLNGARFDYHDDVRDPQGRRQTLEGTLLTGKPGNVRVNFVNGAIVASNGVTGWNFDPARRALTCDAAERVLPTDVLLLLSGSRDPLQYDNVTLMPLAWTPGRPDWWAIELAPRSQAGPDRRRATLLVEPTTLAIRSVLVTDHTGVRHSIALFESSTGTGASTGTLRPTMPSGGTVVRAPGWPGPC